MHMCALFTEWMRAYIRNVAVVCAVHCCASATSFTPTFLCHSALAHLWQTQRAALTTVICKQPVRLDMFTFVVILFRFVHVL